MTPVDARLWMAMVLITGTAGFAQTPSAPDPVRSERRPAIQLPAARVARAGDAPPPRAESRGPSAAETAARGAAREREPIPLAPARSDSGSLDRPSIAGGGGAATTVVGSLALVLAVFFLVVWVSRRAAPKGFAPLPSEVLESLGRAPLGPRQHMQLVRLGNKLVLLAVSANGAEALSEVRDLEEVERLAALCQQHRPGSITASFRQVLSQYAREPAPRGFVGEPLADRAAAARVGDDGRDGLQGL